MSKEGRVSTVEREIALESEDLISVLALYFQILHVAILKRVSFLYTAIFNFKCNLGNGSFKFETGTLLSFLHFSEPRYSINACIWESEIII